MTPGQQTIFAIATDTTLGAPKFEHRFHPSRKWKFDACWPERRIAIEVEGGAWSGGRHVRGKGFLADMEKYNAAVALGWRLLRATWENVGDVIRLAALLT